MIGGEASNYTFILQLQQIRPILHHIKFTF